MKSIRIDRPGDWEYCNVYPIGDLHIGDPHSIETHVKAQIQRVLDDAYGVCILNGDLLNNATRGGVSDVYGEKLSPMAAMKYVVDLLWPIRDKIIGITTGNHENRSYKDDGLDMMHFVASELDLLDVYCPEGIVIFLRFGEKAGKDKHGRHDKCKQLYVGYCTHGAGGGKMIGGKMNNLERLADVVDADFFLQSHTHSPAVIADGYYRVNRISSALEYVDRLFVNTSASLEYGGYGQAKGFRPSSVRTPYIHLLAKKKEMKAIM